MKECVHEWIFHQEFRENKSRNLKKYNKFLGIEVFLNSRNGGGLNVIISINEEMCDQYSLTGAFKKSRFRNIFYFEVSSDFTKFI